MSARGLAIVVVVVVGATAVTPAALAQPALRAEPAVQVIEPPADASAEGMILLRNAGSSTVIAGSITVAPGCDTDAVDVAPLTGFTLAPGGEHPLTVTCAARPASMQRCGYRVRSPANAVLLEFEAVCAYAGSTQLSADRTTVAFADAVVGGSVTQVITLTNTEAVAVERLFIETTDLDGNFTVARPCNPDARACDAAIPSVPPGGTTQLVIACTPRTTGRKTAQLYVTTAAGTRLAAPIALTCNGLPATAPVLSASPTAIDVGAVDVVNATATTTVRITNAGTDELKLFDVQIIDAGTGAALDWQVTARSPCTPAMSPACSLTAGQTVDLDLVFDPSSIAARNATLLIHFRDTADRSIAIPLRGVGRGATLDLVGGGTMLDFGTLPLGAPATLEVEVANRGTRELLAGSLTLVPSGAPFTATPGPMFTLATGASTKVTVTCRPTTEGLFTAHLLIAGDVQTPPLDLTLRCAGDRDTVLTATPPAILLGEVRVAAASATTVRTMIDSVGDPLMLVTAAFDPATTALTVAGVPATTRAPLDLTVAARLDASLLGRLVVTPSEGPPLTIAITGTAVTAAFTVPPAASLGTFCVQQPTTPRLLQLTATGTATLGVSAPALASHDSAFDLEVVAPITYPAKLASLASATIAVTPKRRATAGTVSDDVVWTADADSPLPARTRLTANFVDDGPAIAPQAIAFPDTTIHIDNQQPQEITLQNCDVSTLQLDPPDVPAPFSIDSPNFPSALQPGETTIFTVGFHPTRVGIWERTLVITSPQLTTPLTVSLSGNGVGSSGGDGDAGPLLPSDDPTSFYACGDCASGDASSALIAVAAVMLCAIVPRRRRRSA